MRESAIEQYLVKRVKEAGGTAYKFVSPGRRGVPDRMVVFPGGRVFFVELKAPNGRLRSAQARARTALESQGCVVEVIRRKGQVDDFIEGVTA